MSAIRNYGASLANGDYILFLDNNTEIIDSTAMGEMLGVCMRKEVGAVGGTLYTDSNATFHKGIAVGINGAGTYLYQGVKKGEFGYLMHNRVNENFSALSASCLLVKKEIFQAVGGFSEKFQTDIADIDFGLRICQYNKLLVGVADAGWYYHKPTQPIKIEAKAREEAEQLACQEEELFSILWSQQLSSGDPYYNPNFKKEGSPFTL